MKKNNAPIPNKETAREYIKMAIAENERFNKQENIKEHSWNPFSYLERFYHFRYNYYLAYCKNANPVDEEVADLFMVLQILLEDNHNWAEAINDHSPYNQEFCFRCMETVSKQAELLMKAVEELQGSYYWKELMAKSKGLHKKNNQTLWYIDRDISRYII